LWRKSGAKVAFFCAITKFFRLFFLLCLKFSNFQKNNLVQLTVMVTNGLKGQQALSPGHRPGYKDEGKLALKGQKPYFANDAFALTGR
jgi:hypothetical protein